MKIKVYIEYKVEKDSVALYKENLNIIYSFYDSMSVIGFELYRSRDDLNRFVEEVSFNKGSLSVETLKSKRKELQEQLKNIIKIMDISIFTFTLINPDND